MAAQPVTIDPEIRAFLDEMSARWAAHPPLASLDYPGQRAVCEAVRSRWAEGGPAMARTVERVFDPGAGSLHIRVYLPEGASAPAPALVYLHGGGFTLFSIDTHDRLMREYAAAGGFAVVGVDYPLSPEHKYPVALDRIEALMLWLRDHGDELGIDGSRLAMGGDSAGANLSFATALRLRDRGADGLVGAILSNYGYFSNLISDDAERDFGGPASNLDRDEAIAYYANYLTDMARECANPLVCPLLADMAGMPPVFLVIPQCDLLTEQSVAMAALLRAAGVETADKLYPGATHSFLEAMSVAAVAREAIADGARFVAEKLG
ncbi:alpha/beta hydrolase fold domain-containing protein [Sphingomonas sp. J315]|uniref:alpha/beta hydrolase fold domain-containing protein n=1 Tax=Sphingomonas sp. J315 TaxID=2898433 RepID=UPI0021ADB8B8|nr:alpha/beta hydrolase fold domain-containing protein [Sphingomonas sp. J315]UUY00468.1 alpha/beta hydrolase fold domain-containing protein [Sphingomonas sp. J315]